MTKISPKLRFKFEKNFTKISPKLKDFFKFLANNLTQGSHRMTWE